jgi:hypothetical protein
MSTTNPPASTIFLAGSGWRILKVSYCRRGISIRLGVTSLMTRGVSPSDVAVPPEIFPAAQALRPQGSLVHRSRPFIHSAFPLHTDDESIHWTAVVAAPSVMANVEHGKVPNCFSTCVTASLHRSVLCSSKPDEAGFQQPTYGRRGLPHFCIFESHLFVSFLALCLLAVFRRRDSGPSQAPGSCLALSTRCRTNSTGEGDTEQVGVTWLPIGVTFITLSSCVCAGTTV